MPRFGAGGTSQLPRALYDEAQLEQVIELLRGRTDVVAAYAR